MKENRDAILGKIPVAAGIGFEKLDLGVHAFCGGVGDAMFRVGEQPRQMALKSLRASNDGW